MNGSESLLAVKWVQTAESPAGPGQRHLRGSPDIRRRELHRARCRGTVSPPSTHCEFTPSPCRSLFVFNVSLLVREAKIPQNSFLYPFPEKWANSQLQSLGEFPVLGVWNCQGEAAASQWSLCCHLAQITTKTATATLPPPQQKACHVGTAHTNTPTEPDEGTGLQGGSLRAVHSRRGGTSTLARSHGSPLPAPRPSVSSALPDGKRADTGRRLARSKAQERNS